ncbi:hypothetical protein H8959_004664 [Pygathrix nigripes]
MNPGGRLRPTDCSCSWARREIHQNINFSALQCGKLVTADNCSLPFSRHQSLMRSPNRTGLGNS